MEIPLILTACIVNFGSTSAGPQIQMVDKAMPISVNNESEIRENFQSLFHSIAKNDVNKSEIYREILKQENAREKKIKNALRKGNFNERSNAGENILVTKRETDKNEKCTDETTTLSSAKSSESSESSEENDSLYPDNSNAVDWQEDWHDQASALQREAEGIRQGVTNMREEADALSHQADRMQWSADAVGEFGGGEARNEALNLFKKADDMRQKADEQMKQAVDLQGEADRMFEKIRLGKI